MDTNEAAAEGIRAYLRHVKDIPLLAPDDEVALCRQITAAHGALVAALLAVPAAAHRLRGLCGTIHGEDAAADDHRPHPQQVVERVARLARARCQALAAARVDAAIGVKRVEPAKRPELLAAIERMVSAMPVRSTFVEELAADVIATASGESAGHVAVRLQELRDLKARLVDAHLPLVISIAGKYVHRGVPLAELVKAGNGGLVKAADRFDYRDGFEFATYAAWWIRQAMMPAVARPEPHRQAS
jgi:DNA-directed RNA polymerase sigma subunit (sigma70/sigma32)